MTGIALDYDTHIPGAVLRAAGYTEVFRYLTDLSNPAAWPKGLTLAEVEDLHAHGIKIHLNRETTAKFMLGGYDLGYLEAKRCRSWATQLGFSVDEPIIYSADFQVDSAQQQLIDGFNDGAASVDGKHNVGNYGQYSVIARALDRGYTGTMWQITNSWSWDANKNLLKHPEAYAYQLIRQVNVGGVLCDENELNPNYQGSVTAMAPIPPTIAQKWPSLASQFPPNADYTDTNAIIWADAGSRYAAAQSDVIVEQNGEILAAVKAIQPGTSTPPSGTYSLSDADVDRIAHRVVELFGKSVDAGIATA